jgi:hypothetical protein
MVTNNKAPFEQGFYIGRTEGVGNSNKENKTMSKTMKIVIAAAVAWFLFMR